MTHSMTTKLFIYFVVTVLVPPSTAFGPASSFRPLLKSPEQTYRRGLRKSLSLTRTSTSVSYKRLSDCESEEETLQLPVEYRSFDGSSPLRNPTPQRRVQSNISSGLISNLAVLALKRRLEAQTFVDCDVNLSSSDIILKGLVGPVTVKGRGWKSPLGLTCRAIEATVETCSLDIGRIISNQKLVLTTPANGNAMVALNAMDFGNFITHPLMKPPGLPGASNCAEEKLVFLKDDVSVNHSSGAVTFFGTYLKSKWQFDLKRGSAGAGASITAKLVESGTVDFDEEKVASGLTEATSRFFNEMVFELGGTFLSFRDMMVTDKGKETSVMLSLKIIVKKLPSPGLEF